jgi:hypothetical protein
LLIKLFKSLTPTLSKGRGRSRNNAASPRPSPKGEGEAEDTNSKHYRTLTVKEEIRGIIF